MTGKRNKDAAAGQASRCAGGAFDFAPGTRVGIELPWSRGRRPGEIVGGKAGAFLCVYFPELREIKDRFPKNSEVLVKGVTGDHRLFGFRSSVRHLVLAPYPLLFLTYPSGYECVNLRRAERAGCFVPVRAYRGGEDCPGVLVDLSRTGARLVLDQGAGSVLAGMAEGQEVFLQFAMPDTGREMFVNCHVRTASGGEQAVLGLEFEELLDTACHAVERFVTRARRYAALQ